MASFGQSHDKNQTFQPGARGQFSQPHHRRGAQLAVSLDLGAKPACITASKPWEMWPLLTSLAPTPPALPELSSSRPLLTRVPSWGAALLLAHRRPEFHAAPGARTLSGPYCFLQRKGCRGFRHAGIKMGFGESLREGVTGVQRHQGHHSGIERSTLQSGEQAEHRRLRGPVLPLPLSVRAPTRPRGRDEGSRQGRVETPRHHSPPPGPHSSAPATRSEGRPLPRIVPKACPGLHPAEGRVAELGPRGPLVRVTQRQKLNETSAVTPTALCTQNLTQNGPVA